MRDFKSCLTKEQTMLFPSMDGEDAYKKLLDKSLEKHLVSSKQENVPSHLWDNNRYGLEQSGLFRKLNDGQKDSIYNRLTELNLALSWYIERSGHNYGAKMILLSQTQEEKSMYAIFVAEEAIHQREFENFMTFRPDPRTHWHPMLNPLAKAISDAEKETCVYIIQVLLEGFGMSFYKSLGNQCTFSPLREVYNRILVDEARHHGAGLVAAQMSKPDKIVQEQIFEYSREFINALTSADWVLSAIQSEVTMSAKEERQFYDDIDYFSVVGGRKQKLKEMMEKVDHWGLVERLTREKVLV